MRTVNNQAVIDSGVPLDHPQSQSYVFIAKKLNRKKQRVKSLLESWGAWSRSEVSIKSSAAHAVDEVIATGHDHCLLSDFDSLMIEVDHAISSMNKDSRDLLHRTYKHDVDCPKTYWCMTYGKTPRTYDRKHSAALMFISEKVERND